MTFVLALGNRDQVIQLSDRRLSAAGAAVDEEAGKAGSLVCNDARMTYGFTGLARTGRFSTQKWLLEALEECARPEYEVMPTWERLKEKATETFRSTPEIRSLPPADRRLAVLFAGYLDRADPFLHQAILSNFLYFPTDELSPTAWDEFRLSGAIERQERPEDNPTLLQRVGAIRAVSDPELMALRAMLKARKPAKAIIDKATEVMLTIGDRPGAGGTIGKQISWIKIKSDSADVETGYYSNVPTSVVYLPDGANLRSDSQVLFMGGVAWIEGSNPPAIRVPKVPRNAPCPCRSGRKYKKCHGR